MVQPTQESIDSPAGRSYVRNLLQTALPHPLHDYILEGICKAASGLHVISVLATSGGKTSYMYGFIKLLQALEKLEAPCPFKLAVFPKQPLMIGVFPTKGLEEEMEKTFRTLGINALAINEDTLAAASQSLWTQAASPDLSILLISPELFKSKPYDDLLRLPSFYSRLAILSVDEIHLIMDWGSPEFREAYRDVGLGLSRMPEHVVMFGVTATLPAGDETRKLLDVLSIKPGTFYFSRRSNIRREVQLLVRKLRHGLGSWAFPDLRWIISSGRKTIHPRK